MNQKNPANRPGLAERVGFEPTIPARVCQFSRLVRLAGLRHLSKNPIDILHDFGSCGKPFNRKSIEKALKFLN